MICAIHIGAYLASVFSAIKSLPWPNTLATKDMLLFIIRMIHRYLVQVKKAGLTESLGGKKVGGLMVN
jgi:hypothetical protein